MTIRYIRSGASGANDGTSWANAFTNFQNAIFNAGAGGDTFYVSEDNNSSGTNGNLTRNVANVISAPYKIICADHLGTSPPVAADLRQTAIFKTTLANNISFGAGTYRYWYGINFQLGDGNNNPQFTVGAGNGTGFETFENCSFEIQATGATASWQFNAGGGVGPGKARFINCTFRFNNTGQTMNILDYTCEFIGGGVIGSIFPSTLFTFTGTGSPAIVSTADGFDVSNITGTLAGATASGHVFQFQNCKLGAGVALGVPTTDIGAIVIAGSDSGGKTYRNEISRMQAKLTTEETIVRTGGASDGTTPVSWKIVATANNGYSNPFRSFDIMGFYTLSAASPSPSVTATIELVTDNVTLKDNDIWVEVEYLGDPMADMISSKPNPISAGTNLTTSTATWTTTGLTTPAKQKISVSFIPQKTGLYRARLFIAKASTTIYVDPYLTVA